MEYIDIDSKKMISVRDMPLFNNDYKATDIHFMNKSGTYSLIKMIDLIEYGLMDLIDLLIIESLENIDIEYYVFGKKAINAIISSKKIKKTFYYRFCCKIEHDTVFLAQTIVDFINLKLKKSYTKNIRQQIFKKLKLLNMVSESDLSFYMDSDNDLFYYGKTLHDDIISIFIKLKLRKNMILKNDEIFNFTNYLGHKIPGHDFTRSDENIFYIGIADMGIWDSPYRTSLYQLPYYTHHISIHHDGLKYVDYFYLLFNLIKLLEYFAPYIGYTGYNYYEYESYEPSNLNTTIRKLREIIKPVNVSCLYRTKNNDNDIKEKLCNLYNILKKHPLILDAEFFRRASIYPIYVKAENHPEELFKVDSHDSSLFAPLLKIGNQYLNYTSTQSANCYPILGLYDVDEEYHMPIILTNDGSELSDYARMEEFVHIDDNVNDNCVLRYTEPATSSGIVPLYRPLNIFCVYVKNGLILETETIEEYNVPAQSIIINFSDTRPPITVEMKAAVYNYTNYSSVCTKLNNCFDGFHDKMKATNHYDALNDVFNVYSSQIIYNYMALDSKNMIYSGISYLKSGDVICIPQYLSTTYNQYASIHNFVKHHSTILKIHINKTNRRWLFIGNYSRYPVEYEILLKQCCVFSVIGISTNLIETNHIIKEYNVINLELLDIDIETQTPDIITSIMIDKMLLFSGRFNLYDNILLSSVFSFCAEYVYTKYLSKPFADSAQFLIDIGDTELCNDKMILVDVVHHVNVNGTIISINRPNHGLAHTLRVCAWIYLYTLNCIKHKQFPEITSDIDQNFILQLCVAGLFLVSGRESEAGTNRSGENDYSNCGLDEAKVKYYNNLKPVYTKKSAENFRTTCNDHLFRNSKLFLNPDDVELFAYCIEYQYYISHDEDFTSDPLKKFVGYILNRAHDIDVLRCNPSCAYDPVIDDEAEHIIHRTLALDLCERTGDRILAHNFKYVYDSELVVPIEYRKHRYNDDIFFIASTDVGNCIKIINNTIDEYRKFIIDDIQQNKENFTISSTDLTCYDYDYKQPTIDEFVKYTVKDVQNWGQYILGDDSDAVFGFTIDDIELNGKFLMTIGYDILQIHLEKMLETIPEKEKYLAFNRKNISHIIIKIRTIRNDAPYIMPTLEVFEMYNDISIRIWAAYFINTYDAIKLIGNGKLYGKSTYIDIQNFMIDELGMTIPNISTIIIELRKIRNEGPYVMPTHKVFNMYNDVDIQIWAAHLIDKDDAIKLIGNGKLYGEYNYKYIEYKMKKYRLHRSNIDILIAELKKIRDDTTPIDIRTGTGAGAAAGSVGGGKKNKIFMNNNFDNMEKINDIVINNQIGSTIYLPYGKQFNSIAKKIKDRHVDVERNIIILDKNNSHKSYIDSYNQILHNLNLSGFNSEKFLDTIIKPVITKTLVYHTKKHTTKADPKKIFNDDLFITGNTNTEQRIISGGYHKKFNKYYNKLVDLYNALL